jgi:hypothetical protein
MVNMSSPMANFFRDTSRPLNTRSPKWEKTNYHWNYYVEAEKLSKATVDFFYEKFDAFWRNVAKNRKNAKAARLSRRRNRR